MDIPPYSCRSTDGVWMEGVVTAWVFEYWADWIGDGVDLRKVQ